MFDPTDVLVGIRQSPAKFATMVAPYMADVAIISNFLLLFECVISLAVDDITSSLNELFFDCSLLLLAAKKGRQLLSVETESEVFFSDSFDNT